MYNFLLILGSFCLIMLIASLIKPKWGTFGKKPDLKRKQISVFYLVLVIIFSTLSGLVAPSDIKTENVPVKTSTDVGIKAGIGDTEKRWQSDYGDLSGNDMLKNLKINNSNVNVVFVNNHAVNITIDKLNGYYKNNAIKDMIPADSAETNKENDTSDSMLIKERTSYHSDTLRKVFPETKGDFVVIDTSDAATKAYLNTVIDCTPPAK